MRPLPTYAEAQQELEMEMPYLRMIVEKAFAAWQTREAVSADAHLPTGASMSIKAHDVYGMMVHFAKEHYDGVDGRPLARMYNGNVFGVMLAGRYFVRFKKFDDALDVSNHPTRQNSKYRKQKPTGELTEEHVYLYAGYRPDKPFTQAQGIYLVCRLGDIVEWQMNLVTMVKEETITIVFPVQQPAGERKATGRVKLRRTGTASDDQTTGAASA
jgi:hypothetical protein